MKICPQIQSADAKEMRRQGELAFTMVEIAIAIGVIGFALVAIIGILPYGMNVQKDNREDTVISQDAPYFLDAIRNGAPVSNNLITPAARGLDFLTNYVQMIRFDSIVDGSTNFSPPFPFIYTNFHSGAEILGMLSTPQNNYNSPYFTSNYFITTATVRALSGPATEQNGLNGVMAFTYRMEVMITPFNNFAPDTTNFVDYYKIPNVDPNEWIIRSNRWLEANPIAPNAYATYAIVPGTGVLNFSLFDVRLHFLWPVLPNGGVGPGRQTYRTLVSSQMVQSYTNGVTNLWFFQPQSFTNISAPYL